MTAMGKEEALTCEELRTPRSAAIAWPAPIFRTVILQLSQPLWRPALQDRTDDGEYEHLSLIEKNKSLTTSVSHYLSARNRA
jgi:hypothetical protein